MSHHPCPRPGCPAMVPDRNFACRSDWFALPVKLRRAIILANRPTKVREHEVAMGEAVAWYRAWVESRSVIVSDGRGGKRIVDEYVGDVPPVEPGPPMRRATRRPVRGGGPSEVSDLVE